MDFHRGRLIDHIDLIVRDLGAARRFYGAVLAAIGHGVVQEGDGWFRADELYVTDRGTLTGRMHLAFVAPDRAAVDRFHAAGLAAGGRDNGVPGLRAYHPGYYGAFLLDPDGNNIEAVHHGPVVQTGSGIVVTR